MTQTVTQNKKPPRSLGPELLIELAQIVSVVLVETVPTEYGMDKAKADHVGQEVANRMSGQWGGQQVYFPIGTSIKLCARDLEIYNKFKGDNHSDLAREYGVSLQWIYKIVKAGRTADLASRQGGLFPEG